MIKTRTKTINIYRWVVLGDHNSLLAEGTEQVIGVQQIIVHPRWDGSKLNNDVALIRLTRPAILNERVRTVCLPPAGVDVHPGTSCFITGKPGIYRVDKSCFCLCPQAVLILYSFSKFYIGAFTLRTKEQNG